MQDEFSESHDARQTREWGYFLEAIGWKTEVVYKKEGNPNKEPMYIFVKVIPLIGTMVKIQHPKGPIPFLAIDEIAHKYKASVVLIEPDVSGYQENEYKKNGYEVSKMRYAHSATIKINLEKSEDEIFMTFSENARRNIKKAEKNLVITTVDLFDNKNKKAMDTFYSLYLSLGKMKKFYIPSAKEIYAKLHAFKKHSIILFATEKNNNEKNKDNPVAALWVGICKNTMVYFHPGNTLLGYKTQANYLLVWEALKIAKKRKASYFDFESVYDPRYRFENKGWRGYTEFKNKFGGTTILFPPAWVKFYNPFFKYFYVLGTVLSR